MSLLELRGITKRFGPVLANDAVALSLAPGEALGVLGENGAGKSTLMHILSGLVTPDAGEIVLDGRPVAFASPRDAAAAGIGMVHQHFMLVGALTVAENLALGDPRYGRLRVDYAALRERVGRLAAELGMTIDLDARVDRLAVGAQQQVEIVKTLAREPRILILDEPTAVLAPDEREGLFRTVAALRARGVAVILISHKLEDILQACDRVTVMRQGRVVDTAPVTGRSRADLVRMVVGEDVPKVEHRPARAGAPVLAVQGLQILRRNGAVAVQDASFDLRAGEVLGLAGVDGNGQTELVEALAGMRGWSAGTVTYRLDSERRGPLDAAVLRRLGLAHIPEDRLKHAVARDLSLADNWLLTNLGAAAFNRAGWIRRGPAAARTAQAITDFAVKANGPADRVRQLSGGNQQKLVLARELANEPKLVLAAHPTRGLDVRTIAFVQQQLLAARDRGAAILLVSADLTELWDVADRIMVIAQGRVRGPVAVAETDLAEIGHWMTGH